MWFARNVRDVCDGDGRPWPMYFATVAWLTPTPSFRSSPWIRGAPQSGLASDRVRISARTLAGILGRPKRWRLFQLRSEEGVVAASAPGLDAGVGAPKSLQRGTGAKQRTERQEDRSDERDH